MIMYVAVIEVDSEWARENMEHLTALKSYLDTKVTAALGTVGYIKGSEIVRDETQWEQLHTRYASTHAGLHSCNRAAKP